MLSFCYYENSLFVLPCGVTVAVADLLDSAVGSRVSNVKDSMRGMQSRAQGAGSSSRGIRDGASEGSGPSGLLGDPPHVEGLENVSKRVRGTASNGGADGREFLAPASFATATWGRE